MSWARLAALLFALAGAFAVRAQERPAPPQPGIAAAPGKPGWSVDARSGCWVWNDNPQPGEVVEWSGGCDEKGRASGKGTIGWRSPGRNPERHDGELRDGRLHGRAVSQFSSGMRYEGDWVAGRRHGHGVSTAPSGDRYEGEFRFGAENGSGLLVRANGYRYLGEWRNGRPHGKGSAVSSKGEKYDGEYQDGVWHGRGTAVYANGATYEGEWRNGQRQGKGRFTSPEGEGYEGDWQNGARHGRGIATRPNGERYEGEWANDRRHGRGTVFYPNGERYEAQWENGNATGGTVIGARPQAPPAPAPPRVVHADVPPDESLAPEAYVWLGLPSHERIWGPADWEIALRVFRAMVQRTPQNLPRLASSRSGPVFARIVSREGYARYGAALDDVHDVVAATPFISVIVPSYSQIMGLYMFAFDRGSVGADEAVELLVTFYYMVEVSLKLSANLDQWARRELSGQDPGRRAEGEKGMELMRKGMTTYLGGALLMGLKVLEGDDARWTREHRDRFTQGFLAAAPGMLEAVPAGVRDEFFVNLRRLTDSAKADRQASLRRIDEALRRP